MNQYTLLTLPSLPEELWLKSSPWLLPAHREDSPRAFSSRPATVPESSYKTSKNTTTIPVKVYVVPNTEIVDTDVVGPYIPNTDAANTDFVNPYADNTEVADTNVADAEVIGSEVISPDRPQAFIPQPLAKPWWKPSKKAVVGVGVFTVLSGGILGTTHMFAAMDGHDMGGHDMGSMDGHDMGGHDMGGMSHDDMMRVDGALNATPVTVEVVKPAQLSASVNYTGAIYPFSEVTVYPRVAGQLSNYEIYPGDRVTAGQTLATLDAFERISQTNEAVSNADILRATVEGSQLEFEEQQQAIGLVQADLDYLRLQRDRFAQLTQEGAVSQDQYDLLASQVTAKEALLQGAIAKRDRLQAKITSDQAQVSRAQAEVNTASAFEGYTQITSPINGVVQARMADPGVVVQPGMGILKIGDYQRVRLQANVAQQDANRIQVGTPILATVPGAATGVIRSKITSIFPQTDMTTRTVTVEAVVDNPDGKLLSGQFVDMKIMTEQRSGAIALPQTALVDFNGEPSVWVIAKDQKTEGKKAGNKKEKGEKTEEKPAEQKAERRKVMTGLASSDRIEITSGLKAGDRVITSGHSRLMENSTVTIIEAPDLPMGELGR